MKKKKTLLVVIIILIILLVLAGGAFAYIYFGTDLLKTDKELFGKYFMQMGDEEKGIFPTSLAEYGNKKMSNAYTTNGSFSAVTNILSDTTTDYEMLVLSQLVQFGNNTNISFSGSVDNVNKKVEQDIAINYSDSVSLPFKYKQDGDIYGVQADFLSSSYISIENNNLQDFVQKFGVTDVSTIPNKIETQEIESLKFTDEELAHIQETYITSMFNGLSEDKFSKVENEDGSISYVLTITSIEARDILANMLQTLSTDTMMINKVNSIITEVYGTAIPELTSADIQEMRDDLLATTLTETSFNLSVTQNNGVTNALSITSGEAKIEFLINKSDSNAIYTLNASVNPISISMEMTYSGINTNTVTEAVDINLNITEVLDTTYSYENTVNFDSSINIEGFDSTNVVLNNYPAEQLQPFVLQVANIIVQTNNSQMTQLGFPTELGNPMVMWVAGPSIVLTSNYIIDSAQDSIEGSSLQEQEVEANNAQFTMYEGLISGVSAKTLCNTVLSHNLSSASNEQINVKLGENASATSFTTNVNDINEIINSISSGSTYNVTFSYDAATGYICEIGIVSATGS